MEKMYDIKDNYAEIVLLEKNYPLVAVKKALSNYMEDVYIKIDGNDDKIIIKLFLKENKNDLDKIIGELYNELLRESLRYSISLETKNLRELIVGRALYTTCIDLEEEPNKYIPNESEEYSLDKIAVNWFDEHTDEMELEC